ncbi:MAG: hypothetical protein Q4E54_07570 [Lachnospiraceae bacterium]|nr:hypothetical protein [Lachnospiraceae bacterium]
MNYTTVFKAKFIERPNRFIAIVEINGKKATVHVKNTGRCKELLVKGAVVYLSKSDNPERKTAYDCIVTPDSINIDKKVRVKLFQSKKGLLWAKGDSDLLKY